MVILVLLEEMEWAEVAHRMEADTRQEGADKQAEMARMMQVEIMGGIRCPAAQIK